MRCPERKKKTRSSGTREGCNRLQGRDERGQGGEGREGGRTKEDGDHFLDPSRTGWRGVDETDQRVEMYMYSNVMHGHGRRNIMAVRLYLNRSGRPSSVYLVQ